MARKSRVLTDHEEIRRWAEERDAQPACVRGTGSEEDVGMIRLDFPGYSGERSLEPIEWDEWLDKFEESNLALLVEDETAGGEKSNFNKIIGRETASVRSPGSKTSRRAQRSEQSGTRRRSASARSRSKGARASRTASRSRRGTSARGSSSRGSKSRSTRATSGKKRTQSARSNSRSRSRRRAA